MWISILMNKKNIDFLFSSVHKHKLMHGFSPKNKMDIWFYTTHSIGFFIKKSVDLGLYDTQYKYSADYDLFYRMIVKKFKGIATKKMKYLENLDKADYHQELDT